MCAYLETWHLDIEEFLDLRKNTGDDRRRTHDMNTANWVPDLFMKRVELDKNWTLFSPGETPDLHDLTGLAFEKRYEEYEALAAEGKMDQHKTIPAKDLWRKMLTMLLKQVIRGSLLKTHAICALRNNTLESFIHPIYVPR